jgi:hypothetical protein
MFMTHIQFGFIETLKPKQKNQSSFSLEAFKEVHEY